MLNHHTFSRRNAARIFIALCSVFMGSAFLNAQKCDNIFLDNGNVKTVIGFFVSNEGFTLNTDFDVDPSLPCGATECALSYFLNTPLPADAKVKLVPESGWLAPKDVQGSARISVDGLSIKVLVKNSSPLQGTGTAFALEVDGLGIDANTFVARLGGGLAITEIADPGKMADPGNANNSMLEIGPNPSVDHLNIHNPMAETVQANLVNSSGKWVKSLTIPAGGHLRENIQELPAGMYHLTYNANSEYQSFFIQVTR